MNYQTSQILGKWWQHTGLVRSAYRFLAFAIATAQIFVFPSADRSVIPPLILVSGVGIYTVLTTLHPFGWYRRGMLIFCVLGTDIAVCIFLVISTGGLYSPFLLYTLAPVLTAALLLDGKVTFSIASLSVGYVIGSHLGNPFFATQLSLPELSYFLVYMIAVCLAAVLPYLTNVNLRQRLQSQDILGERRRLSREIHDGTAQTLAALHWQVDLLRRRLIQMGIELDEVNQLERLTEKARRDTRECVELLRKYTGDGSLLPHLKDYLEHLRRDSNIDFCFDAETGDLRLEALVELELLCICQEALTNVRTHSKAHHVQVKLEQVDNRLKMSIADDGSGFNALAYYRDGLQTKGHGLAVMQERAESIGGKLRVLSMPGQGTEIQVEVPANPRQRRLLWLKR